MCKKKTTSLGRLRYQLHEQVREQGYELVTKTKTIYVPYFTTNYSTAVTRLQKEFGYQIAWKIDHFEKLKTRWNKQQKKKKKSPKQ